MGVTSVLIHVGKCVTVAGEQEIGEGNMSPLFEYRCHICNHKYERLRTQGMGSNDTCPKCSCLSGRVFSVCNWSFGWTFTDEAMNVKGVPDELLRNV